jgi:hypothetical protein
MGKKGLGDYKNVHSAQVAGYTAATATEDLSLNSTEFDALLPHEMPVELSTDDETEIISTEFLGRLTGHGRKEACEGCE